MNAFKMAGLFDNDVFKSWSQHQLAAAWCFATSFLVLVQGVIVMACPPWVSVASAAALSGWLALGIHCSKRILPAPQPIPWSADGGQRA